MSAKIKNHRRGYHHFRPKGTKARNFEQVYWPYLPIVVAIVGLIWYGQSHGNFNYAYQYGARGQDFNPQLAFLPLTSKLAAISIWSVFIAALGTLVIKHLRQIKRSLHKGENYALHHPAMDVGLIVVISLSYLISQTSVYAF